MAKRRKSFAGLRGAIVGEVEQQMYVAGSLVATTAQISITQGAVSGKNHVASASGEPPNNDTADLANSIQVLQTGRLAVRIIADAPHAVPLELGTSKMAARPFMKPAAVQSRPEVNRMLSRAARAGVRKHFRR